LTPDHSPDIYVLLISCQDNSYTSYNERSQYQVLSQHDTNCKMDNGRQPWNRNQPVITSENQMGMQCLGVIVFVSQPLKKRREVINGEDFNGKTFWIKRDHQLCNIQLLHDQTTIPDM